MDFRADERIGFIVHWSNLIENEVKALVKDSENDREDLEEIRSAAAGLRMQAEALEGKITLKPEEPAEDVLPAPGEDPAGAALATSEAGEEVVKPPEISPGARKSKAKSGKVK